LDIFFEELSVLCDILIYTTLDENIATSAIRKFIEKNPKSQKYLVGICGTN
jgi:hypothetical protein